MKKAIILSAGQGSRLGHLTDDKPKCLIDFNGRTLLDRQLDALAATSPALLLEPPDSRSTRGANG